MSNEIAAWGLVLFTAALVWVTWKLASHTKTHAEHTEILARLTNELVGIEQSREERIQSEKRQGEVSRALKLAEVLLTVTAAEFVREFARPWGPLLPGWATSIRGLALLGRLIKDPQCVEHLTYLRGIVDSVQYPTRPSAVNEDETKKQLVTLQQRLNWSVTEWRDEIVANATTRT